MSSFWSKLGTAIRGGASETGEKIIDSQSIRIYEQEIRDAENDLKKAEQELTKIMAKETLAKEKVLELEDLVTKRSSEIEDCLSKGREDLALKVAEKLSDLEVELEDRKATLDSFSQHVSVLKRQVSGNKKDIERMKVQADQVKATAAVQKSMESSASRYMDSNSRLKTAASSLERIKQKQKEKGAQLEAASRLANEESGDDLQAELRKAGIGGSSPGAESVLARFKNKQTAASV